MSFDFPIPTPSGQIQLSVKAGSSMLFVGPNGGGKTRLAVHIENSLALKAHRISAHRALALNPNVPKISEQQALHGLRTGWADERTAVQTRSQQRWQHKEAVFLLNDFDFLIQALFADQSNKALKTHKKARNGDFSNVHPTRFEQLVEVWERLLPHRSLTISGDDVEVSIPDKDVIYKGAEMSDGERAIFYMIGQTLVAAEDSVLIIDEPELHVHRSIMGKLWDELEAARQDCAFIFITHDLEFAAARVAQKFVIRNYDSTPRWTIESVPDNTGFDEETTTLILGSRRPILFVEGDESSLDAAIYRCCYPEWTVIPKESCEQVVHSVVTMRRNKELTRVTCSGIIDADDHQATEIVYLAKLGVAVLSVSEIENLILLPGVSRAIAINEGYEGVELETRLSSLQNAIFDTLNSPAATDAVVVRYCRRRVDRLLKKIDLSQHSTIPDITVEYTRQIAALNIPDIARSANDRIQKALVDRDLPALLANYDNKALLPLAARFLKNSNLKDFEAWLTRVLRGSKVPALTAAISASLPKIQAQ